MTPIHYLNKCCLIVNSTLGNKFQWRLSLITATLIQENEVENIVYKNVLTCLDTGLGVLLAKGKSQVHCDNKPQQTGPNREYSMAF